VAERWAATGVRPNTRGLREILYQQLTGFDIDEAALRFAALGLYLSAIELDPSPEPVNKLRFENLRDRVLWKMGDLYAEQADARLGSLGPLVGSKHSGRYDIVVGNPPWTGSGRLAGWPRVRDRVAQISKERLGAEYPPPPLPNEVPDLAFVWRAMEWCRPGGRISFAISARMLFQQGDGMPVARGAIFSALDVTGVVNGSDLRTTNVWPGISAPFCLLFARNRVPPPGSGFRFLSPRLEQPLNDAGIMRIDTRNAEVVSARQLIERPTILKTLFRGTRLDLDLLQRIHAKAFPTLLEYWQALIGEANCTYCRTGNGYQRLRPSTKEPQSARHLLGWPDLIATDEMPLSLDDIDLPRFDQQYVHRARNEGIYRGPLALVHKSPPAARRRIATGVAIRDIVYNQSYYGYSSRGHSQASRLAKYVALFLQSRFALWYSLVTSGEFGFERETIEKSTIDAIPIVPLESLRATDLAMVDSLFQDLSVGDAEEDWSALDAWVVSTLGLKPQDVQTIEDTLDSQLPFSSTQKRAQEAPTEDDVAAFCMELNDQLAPWAVSLGSALAVAPRPFQDMSAPWMILTVAAEQDRPRQQLRHAAEPWAEIIGLADRMAATEIIMPDRDGRTLWIARLRQHRYWTSSQAKLLAERIAWEHLDDLLGDCAA